MGVMRRTSDSNSAVITFGSSSDNKNDSRSWCPSCAKVGINSPLRSRIYLDEQGKITSPGPDSKNWRQCHLCGEIVGVYEAKVEADIETLAEPRPTAFNNLSSSEQAEEPIQPEESRLAKHRKKKHKQDLEQYKEQDIKDALRKGKKLVSYAEEI
jgi:hypothetical protein